MAGQTSMTLLERACALIGDEVVDTRVGAYVYGSVGRFYGLAGLAGEAVELDERAMAGAERVGDRRLYAWALNNRGVARCNHGEAGGLEDIERALEISLEIGSFDVGRCRINLGATLGDRGDLTAAREHLEAGLAFATGVGWRRFETIMSSELARNRLVAGQWDEAAALATRFLDEVRDGYHQSELQGVLLVIASERGQPLDADEVARTSARAREIGDVQVLLPWLAAASRALATTGDHEGANRYLDEVLSLCVGAAATYLRGGWFYDAAVAATLLGREADVLAAADGRAATRWSDAAVALLSGEPLRAAETLAAMGAFDEAGARLAAAQALADDGRGAEAAAQADRALTLYRSLAAGPGIARAEAIIVATAPGTGELAQPESA
jgi:tetratricopeptide (TPR) repeat protein